ncbi:MAG TPA: hypothetical protein VEU47_03890 [Candidatus Cybelea sp.]|nr:hypothetical protein [Candidatus Cybelea sp.]
MIWLLPLAAFLAAAAATGGVLALLRRRAILDHPNERSSHSVPTPRGAGLAVIPVLALAWVAIGLDFRAGIALALGVALAAFSWADDLKGVPVALRLLVQAAAVIIGVTTLPEGAQVAQGLLPPILDRVLAVLAWLWFVNLFNFMDGIDGISAVEAIGIGAGLTIVAVVSGDRGHMPLYGLALAAATAGFLLWNWPPARIFLGDVGSVGLGYLLGWLLLRLAAAGYWAPALLLPLYYLGDATLTLGRRLIAGERVWQAHRSHFYQQAARRFASHARVSLSIAAVNAALIALAAWSALDAGVTVAALLAGAVLVGGLLWHFSDHGGSLRHAG